MTKPKSPEVGSRFRTWLAQYLSDEGLSNIAAGAAFGLNDSLIGHYLRGERLPSYVSLQKIRNAVPGLDVNILFD